MSDQNIFCWCHRKYLTTVKVLLNRKHGCCFGDDWFGKWFRNSVMSSDWLIIRNDISVWETFYTYNNALYYVFIIYLYVRKILRIKINDVNRSTTTRNIFSGSQVWCSAVGNINKQSNSFNRYRQLRSPEIYLFLPEIFQFLTSYKF